MPASLDGTFSIRLPEGRYEVRHGSSHTSLTVLPGGVYALDLTPDRVLDFKVGYQNAKNNEITVQVSMTGGGDHHFSIRSDNLAISDPEPQSVHLASGTTKEIIWHARVVSLETPWVAVVVPDGDLSKRAEITGVELDRGKDADSVSRQSCLNWKDTEEDKRERLRLWLCSSLLLLRGSLKRGYMYRRSP